MAYYVNKTGALYHFRVDVGLLRKNLINILVAQARPCFRLVIIDITILLNVIAVFYSKIGQMWTYRRQIHGSGSLNSEFRSVHMGMPLESDILDFTRFWILASVIVTCFQLWWNCVHMRAVSLEIVCLSYIECIKIYYYTLSLYRKN